MTELADRIRALTRTCDDVVFWHHERTPAQDFAALAAACDELGVTQHDIYGDGGAVALVETRVAELFGKPAAAFFPSGIMAQQCMLRVWCERSGSMRVGIPDLSHLLTHEDDGPRLLHDFRFEPLTTGSQAASAADLARLGGGLGAVLVELPLRDAGHLLPAWGELADLSAAARAAGTPLHLDAARIWESQEHLGHSLAEIGALADSLYVSFYKGLGGLSGACLTGPVDAIAEAKVWRHRMGGTLYHLTPYAVSALVGLRDGLPRMGEYVAWARALAAALVGQGFTVSPNPPHTNSFVVFAPGDPDDLNARLLAHIEQSGVATWPAWRPADVPGWSRAELAVHAAALGHEPAAVAATVARLTSPDGR